MITFIEGCFGLFTSSLVIKNLFRGVQVFLDLFLLYNKNIILFLDRQILKILTRSLFFTFHKLLINKKYLFTFMIKKKMLDNFFCFSFIHVLLKYIFNLGKDKKKVCIQMYFYTFILIFWVITMVTRGVLGIFMLVF